MTAPTAAPALKAVLHVSEADRLAHALANAENLRAARPDAEIRLVLNGGAVTAVQGQNKVTEKLGQALAAGLKVQLCRNALKAQGMELDGNTLPDGMEVVPAGVLALAEAQQDGFAYIKV